eukprot:11180472-Lingulodinium_polyedra.AAC.1
MDNFMLSAECSAVVKGLAATKAYATRVEGMSQEEKEKQFGHPHCHLWNVLLAEAAETPGVWQEPSKEYIKYLADKGAMKTIMQEVKH